MIKKNLKNGKYITLQEALNDIQLIWDNCKTYNMEGSVFIKLSRIYIKWLFIVRS